MASVTIYAEQDGGEMSNSGTDWENLLSKTTGSMAETTIYAEAEEGGGRAASAASRLCLLLGAGWTRKELARAQGISLGRMSALLRPAREVSCG